MLLLSFPFLFFYIDRHFHICLNNSLDWHHLFHKIQFLFSLFSYGQKYSELLSIDLLHNRHGVVHYYFSFECMGKKWFSVLFFCNETAFQVKTSTAYKEKNWWFSYFLIKVGPIFLATSSGKKKKKTIIAGDVTVVFTHSMSGSYITRAFYVINDLWWQMVNDNLLTL